jgi:hypothetical protein
MALSKITEMGYFGNIWVRSHFLEKAGDINDDEGHLHYFDHVSLLYKGRVRVEVTDPETGNSNTKEFQAPTFIVIRKTHKHKITALEDECGWYCVFALRDVNGDITDVYSGNNDPYGGPLEDDYWTKQKLVNLEKNTVE